MQEWPLTCDRGRATAPDGAAQLATARHTRSAVVGHPLEVVSRRREALAFECDGRRVLKVA